MENCYFSKLKGGVEGNLPVFGVAYATIVVAAVNQGIDVVCGNLNGGGTIKLIDGDPTGFTLNNLSDEVMSKSDNVVTIINNSDSAYRGTTATNVNYLKFTKTGTYKVAFDKYNISLVPISNNGTSASIYYFIEDLSFLQSPSYIAINDNAYQCIGGDIDILVDKVKSDTETFFISGGSGDYATYRLKGNISELANLTSLTGIKLTRQSFLEGNLKTLIDTHPNASNITRIDLFNCVNITGGSIVTMLGGLTKLVVFGGENNTHFSGSVAELAQAQVSNGRISGILRIDGYMPNVIPAASSSGRTIKFGSSMVNPTEQETTQGYQIV